jgi:hypothetical protein
MVIVVENYPKFEACMLITFLQAEGMGQSKIHHRLVKEVSLWYNKFKDGQTALNDDAEKLRGRPRTPTNG